MLQELIEERAQLQYERAVQAQKDYDTQSQSTATVAGHDAATGLAWVATVGSGPTRAKSLTTASLPVGDRVSYFTDGGRGFVNKAGAI